MGSDVARAVVRSPGKGYKVIITVNPFFAIISPARLGITGLAGVLPGFFLTLTLKSALERLQNIQTPI